MPHESAVAALRMLHAAGKTIVVISNSSKRRIVSLEGMVALGIEPALVDHVVTSGEEAWQAFAARRDPFYAALGRRCRSEEHTSELQSLMRISYAVFCLNKKKIDIHKQ